LIKICFHKEGLFYWGVSSSAVFPIIDKGLKFYTKGVTGFVDVQDLVRI
jgi:hypothetical protein